VGTPEGSWGFRKETKGVVDYFVGVSQQSDNSRRELGGSRQGTKGREID